MNSYTNIIVTDGSRTGEIWVVGVNPYTDQGLAAYVVGNDWADWIALDTLTDVNGAAITAEAEIAA